VDERAVADWQAAAGAHWRGIHEAMVHRGQLDLQQVQTDELRVKVQGAVLWLALVVAVSTRLWLGDVVSQTRDIPMALVLALQVKACALCRPLLVCFDGFVSYIKAFQQCLRTPLRERAPVGL
jgi:transposase-like protein